MLWKFKTDAEDNLNRLDFILFTTAQSIGGREISLLIV